MQVTPELIKWLDSQRQAGFSNEVLLKALVDAGYTEAFAQGFVSTSGAATSSQSLMPNVAAAATSPATSTATSTANFTANSSHSSTATVSADSASHAAILQGFQSVPAASLAWFGQQSVTRVLDVDVGVLLQMKHPQLAVFEGLLTDAECDELIEQARARLSSSLTVDSNSGNSVQHQARVSSGMFFSRAETALIELVEKRMSALLGFPETHGEGLQILNYKPGGKYDPHQDYFDPAHSGSHVHLARGGQRIGTLICYLNTPKSGGGTVFPDVGLTVSAVRGRAVYFAYPLAHASSACLHGGNPVIEGEKWIATKWIRQSVFQ